MGNGKRWVMGVGLGMIVAWPRVGRGDVFSIPVSEGVSEQLVTVGDPGNVANSDGHGSVAYSFNMAVYDTTVLQYSIFLNSIGSSDPMGCWNPSMSSLIVRTGNVGSYSYSVSSPIDNNLPIDEVSDLDAIRYCNWISNGQLSTGNEDNSTTENGSYDLANPGQQGINITRAPNATYVVPSLDELYKTGYYKGGSKNAGYWLYPTQSDTPPSNVLSATGTNNATYDNGTFSDPTTFLTPVGSYANDPSAYGTYDQGGDVFQWTDTEINGPQRASLGGSYNLGASYMEAGFIQGGGPSGYSSENGFRIAEVPEPCSLAIFAIGSGGLCKRKRRRTS